MTQMTQQQRDELARIEGLLRARMDKAQRRLKHTLNVADTAAEVKALRKEGFRVGAVFFGQTRNVSCLKTIYGREFVRIQKIDQLAGAVGSLLQRQLREMD